MLVSFAPKDTNKNRALLPKKIRPIWRKFALFEIDVFAKIKERILLFALICLFAVVKYFEAHLT